MASAAVMTAIEARLAANWTRTPIITANDTANSPDDGSAYLVVEYPVANENQISLGAPGSRLFREDGGVLLTLVVPAGAGVNTSPNTWATWFDALRAAFRGAQFNGVSTWAPQPPRIGDANDQGAYFSMTTVIPYYFDLQG